jgi:flagellar motility protein MotE (MotC chaperone)
MTASVLRRRHRGTLHILAGLLMLSAVLRAGGHIDPAFAQENPPPEPAPAAATDQVQASEMLTAFQAREARLAEREGQLRDRIQALRVAEIEIAEKLEAMRRAEDSLNATIAQAETAAATDVDLLRAVYENMKPKDAAALFVEMPPHFAAGFLGIMRPEASALIMSALPPEVAYSFSVVLAGRNANVPTD